MTQQRISIAGTGYVGLCTAAGFASKGYRVITSTHDREKASSINRGIPPFYEPGLEELLQKVVRDGNLQCIIDREKAVLDTDITFIAVGTPSRPDGSIDLQYIESSAREIGEALNRKDTYHLVVVKSTVVPGTTENVVKPALEKYSNKRCGVDFGLCMSPEFLREGSALYDTLHPDRVVIGEHDKKSGDLLENLFKDFYSEKVLPWDNIIKTSLPNAELIKYSNNAFLATKISFINTIANLCEKIRGTDVTTIAKAIGIDERINPRFLGAGLGYGGSCFPKDVKALIAFSKDLGYKPLLLSAAQEVNRNQPYTAIDLSRKLLGDLQGRQMAILGLAFKPNTDDMREAVSIKIISKLLEAGASIVAYDPAATSNAKRIFEERIRYATSTIECIKGAECCIIVTEWDEFKSLKPQDFIKNMKSPVLIDGRRIYNPEEFSRKLKFAAVGLGY